MKLFPKEKRLYFGLIVGGFSSDEYLSEVYEIQIPHHDTKGSSVHVRNQGDFGVNWFAWCHPITRYMNGYDLKLVDDIINYFIKKRGGAPLSLTETQEIISIINKYQYKVPYNGMSLQEGINHTKFLVELVINHYHYASGDPIIGGNPIVGGSVKIGNVSYRNKKFEIQPDS